MRLDEMMEENRKASKRYISSISRLLRWSPQPGSNWWPHPYHG